MLMLRLIYFFWLHRRPLLKFPKRKKGQRNGDLNTMAKNPKPPYRYICSFFFILIFLKLPLSNTSKQKKKKHSQRNKKKIKASFLLHFRFQVVPLLSLIVFMRPIPTSPPQNKAHRKRALSLQIPLQKHHSYRRTSADWPTTVSSYFYVF